MKNLMSLLVLLCCVLSASAEDWDKAGTWKTLCLTSFKNQVVTIQYDAANIMFPGIGRPEPSMDFILLAIYPKVMGGHLDKDGILRFTPTQDYCYMHVSGVATEAGTTFHVLRYRNADSLNPGYDGRELLQYEGGKALLGRLSGPAQLEPIWKALLPIVQEYARTHDP